jgi:hypothetical protein
VRDSAASDRRSFMEFRKPALELQRSRPLLKAAAALSTPIRDYLGSILPEDNRLAQVPD